jgi:hypothetical protein
MAMFPQLPAEIDLSKIRYAEMRVNPATQAKSVGIFYGNSRLTVEFPLMPIAYNGISKCENKDKAGNVLGYRYEMNVSFKGLEENPRVKELHQFLEKFQNKMKKDGFDNRLTWFKDSFDDEPKFVAKMFQPLILQSKDKATGRPDGKWPDTYKIKLPYDEDANRFTFEAHDMNKNELDFMEVWDKMKGGRCKPVLQLSSVWFAGGKFGTSWRLLMSKFQMNSRSTFTYRPDDEDDKGLNTVADDDDDDDIDIPPQILEKHTTKPAPAPVPTVSAAIEDSDEEEEDVEDEDGEGGSDEEEAEDDSEAEPERRPTPPPPPPPPVKTKVASKKPTKTAKA